METTFQLNMLRVIFSRILCSSPLGLLLTTTPFWFSPHLLLFVLFVFMNMFKLWFYSSQIFVWSHPSCVTLKKKWKLSHVTQTQYNLLQVAEIFHSVFSLRESEREEMEKVKAEIDERAKTLTQRELWAGYGLILAQIIGSMRLTFWELSWDVMEPICYFVSCIYFMVGYTFFLRTSNQPCYNGIYESRFNSQQKRLMKLHNFDIDRYNELKGVVVPSQFHKKLQWV